MNNFIKLGLAIIAAGMMLVPAFGYAQTSESAVTTTIEYFYSASGQMMDAEDNNGVMSSYLTRGERYNGTSETFAVSNIKDITADLDSNGNVVNKYTYTAYGTQTSYSPNTQITTSTNPQLSISVNPYTYDEYYTDSESGNYYLNARYYDPTLGIFLTSDSYNLPNRYMYVNGNPVMGTDPTGHVTNLLCFHIGWDETGAFHFAGGRWGESAAYHKLHAQEQKQQILKQDKNTDSNLLNYAPNADNKSSYLKQTENSCVLEQKSEDIEIPYTKQDFNNSYFLSPENFKAYDLYGFYDNFDPDYAAEDFEEAIKSSRKGEMDYSSFSDLQSIALYEHTKENNTPLRNQLKKKLAKISDNDLQLVAATMVKYLMNKSYEEGGIVDVEEVYKQKLSYTSTWLGWAMMIKAGEPKPDDEMLDPYKNGIYSAISE